MGQIIIDIQNGATATGVWVNGEKIEPENVIVPATAARDSRTEKTKNAVKALFKATAARIVGTEKTMNVEEDPAASGSSSKGAEKSDHGN
ncbi:hypothetical protein GQX73_g1307 [Xylaria multiplex]|uniref:Uncharacterized protein n=1 Tax=Xylaria multiplex TaxID=323545 RepID=A0A7C8MZW1_9PEZI|nr:hypothetical protein GQX73_g1307 [Xylaria multiplex]